MKKDDIINAVKILLNNNDDYEVVIKTNNIKVNLTYSLKVIPMFSNKYEKYLDGTILISRFERMEFAKLKLEEDRTNELIKDLLPTELIFSSYQEMEKYLSDILREKSLWLCISKEDKEIGFTYDTGEFQRVINIARFEIIFKN